jgi:hypothetical protein
VVYISWFTAGGETIRWEIFRAEAAPRSLADKVYSNVRGIDLYYDYTGWCGAADVLNVSKLIRQVFWSIEGSDKARMASMFNGDDETMLSPWHKPCHSPLEPETGAHTTVVDAGYKGAVAGCRHGAKSMLEGVGS